MTDTSRALGAIAAGGLLLLTVTACGGSDSDADADKETIGDPASGFVCAADATAVDVPASLSDVPIPDRSVVYDVENREGAGTIITAANPAAMDDVLAQLNQAYKSGGFSITEGETEDHDAEASWTGASLSGRWAIKDTASDCGGSGTQIQILVSSDGQ